MKKRILRFCMILAILPMLFLTACTPNPEQNTPAPPKQATVGALFAEIAQNALPAQKDDIPDLAPGTPTPLEYLKQAPQDLVGRQLELTLSEMSDGSVVYRYVAEEKQLILLYYKYSTDPFGRDRLAPVMLVMKTEYASMAEFLSQTDMWKGSVTAVKIICGNDFMTSHSSVTAAFRAENAKYAEESSTVCYGIITTEGENTAFDQNQPWYEDYGAAFDRTPERFGIE